MVFEKLTKIYVSSSVDSFRAEVIGFLSLKKLKQNGAEMHS
jgi:hypothetical protein